MAVEGRFAEEFINIGIASESFGGNQTGCTSEYAATAKTVSHWADFLNGSLFNNLNLASRILSDARGLKDLPSLEGCTSLEILRVDRANLTRIPENLCKTSPRLKSL